jgi:sugar/nucleoside kinase (ribokinase family)
MKKVVQLCGLGNSLIDILIDVEDSFIEEFGFEKGTMRLVDLHEQHSLLERLRPHTVRRASGGSVANSTIAFSQLGGTAGFIGCVADDETGRFFRQEFKELGIDFPVPPVAERGTGSCISLITPDAERTMRTCLGVSTSLSAQHVDEETIARAEWLFLEGYLFANPENGQSAVQRAVEIARDSKTKIAVTFSESWVIEIARQEFEKVINHAEFIFANEAEACSFAKTENIDTAFNCLRDTVPGCAITLGPNGAIVRYGKESGRVKAYPCDPIDLTGAGDMFAGSVLYALARNGSLLDGAQRGCYLASRVITQVGARLQTKVRDLWDNSPSPPV